MSEPYDAVFYLGHGWDDLTGPDSEQTRELKETLEARKEWVPLVGNLDDERLVATFPGTRCLLPINWLAMPERKFEYVLIRTEPGESFPEHVHGYGDEIYLVLSGQGTVFLDGVGARGRRRRHLPHPARHAARLHASPDSETTFDLFVVNARACRRAPLALLGGRADRGRRAGRRRSGARVAMTQSGASRRRRPRRRRAPPADPQRRDPARPRLQQDDIAAQLQVSITPVREALRQLAAEGLVVSEPHKGVTVPLLDIDGREGRLHRRAG